MAAKQERNSAQFATIWGLAVRLAKVTEADALLLWSDFDTNWSILEKSSDQLTVLVASHSQEYVAGAVDAGLDVILVDVGDAPVQEALSHALLKSITDELLEPGAGVIAVYNGFDTDGPDSVSYLRLDEHLGRLTTRDLRQLSTNVPLDVLKLVVDLAIEIGREGREGKPVGCMFVVGDSRKVSGYCTPTGFDPMKGYTRKDRTLRDSRVREGIKELAQLDGAFVISADGIVESACQSIDASSAKITLSKGLGTRHIAAAAISKKSNAIAIAVSESSGTVRIFQNGQVMLRIEPFRRAMKWHGFEVEGGE